MNEAEVIGVHVPSLAAVLVGALLALGFVGVARRGRPDPLVVYAVGLVVAALAYVAFAAFGAPAQLPRELGGLLMFGAAAWLGARRWPLLLVVAWAMHVAWDVVLHPYGTADGVPWWYPPLCIGFDLVVAAAVLFRPRASEGNA